MNVCPHGLLSARLCESLRLIRIRPGTEWTATVGDRTLAESSGSALRGPLVKALYDVLHAGRGEISQRSRSLRNPEFEKRLLAATPHSGTSAFAQLVGPVSGPGDGADEAVVEYSGVRVRVPTGSIRSTGTLLPGDTVSVEMPAARPALSPGFFLADGSHGRPGRTALLRLYVHVSDSDSAPGAWNSALSRLESEGVRYRAKILSSPQLFPRTDSLVIYLGPDAWQITTGLVGTLELLPGVRPTTSVFARCLAPGVAMAWEPADGRLGRAHLSYGQHRSAALADALIRHATGKNSSTLDQLVHQSLFDAGIDPKSPEQNIDSPEIEISR
ncbi:T3SS effector HopA1 family protein [Streptomyces vinaceus]|uniref:T3SS effector HopA1 family protein n=1 Tax=Streptomyces vinaceus TaxID=1960 RepID=UPI0038239B5A